MDQLPPLNGLRAFDAAGRRLSFRAAADELGVTQGAVAQQVRQLEAYLDITLFERLPKGLALTAAGRRYHNAVSAAFTDLRAATSQLKPQPDRVVISVTPTFAAKWLIPNLYDFSAQHPEIDLQILATEKTSSFHSDGIDLAIRLAEPPFGAALSAGRLFEQELIAVAAPALVKTETLPLSPDAFLKLPKLHDSHNHWPRLLAALGAGPADERGLRLSQTALALDASLAGQGVALVSRFFAEQDIKAGNLVQVIPNSIRVPQDFYLLYDRKAKSNAALQAVVTWLTSRAAQTC